MHTSRTVVQLKRLTLLLIGSLLAPSVPAQALPAAPFPDMEHSWSGYKEAVSVLKDRGVISGYENGTFEPRSTINRAEFLKLVFASRGAQEPVQGECFADVPADAWFAPFVCAAQRRGIAKGYPDPSASSGQARSFKPEQEVNWAEAIALITRTYGWDVDERDGERWYAPFVETIDRRDVVSEHSYVPWAALSRERAADLVYRMLQFERGITFERSPGCTADDTKVPTTFTVNGVERSFLITVPQSANRNEPTPILIAFHGRTNSNERVKSYMRFEREAPEMIVVYPAGLPNGGGYTWAGGPGADVAFFDALIEHIGAHVCIDMNRIYVAGHSLGAWMANSIACLRGDIVRASGTVGGDGIGANCTGPAAGFIAHNPDDTLSPFAGSERIRQHRVEENACTWETDPGPKLLSCVRHTGCQSGNDVLWCPHEIDTDERGEYYPHTWPRGTGKSIVEFFRDLDA